MKLLATSLSLAALLLGAATASAQTTFRLGLRAGVNRALTTQAAAGNYSESGGTYSITYTADKSAIYAWQAGAVFEVSFGKLSLQPAVVFSQKGETAHTSIYSKSIGYYYYNQSDKTSTNRYNWLEVPINVVYTTHGDHGLQLFAGPYVAFGIGGRQTGTQSYNSSGVIGPQSYPIDEQISYGADTNNKRLDMGLNFGLGYRQGPLQVQLGYGLGLLTLHRASPPTIDPGFSPQYHDFNGDPAYNHVAQLTGTYFFSL
ncbi:MAG: PorT family protein [Hymenobacter sp.]|nr:MAG: PorT family protein [Hymenobacter sp.]